MPDAHISIRRPSRSRWGRLAAAGLLLGPALPTTASSGDPPVAAPEVVEIIGCRVEFARSSTLGTPQAGVLKECLVRDGDRVAAGQLVGRLRDEDVRAELEFRRVTGDNPVNVRLAESRKALADSKLRRSQEIKRRGYVSDADLQGAEVEAKLAGLDVDSAKQQQLLAQIQARQAEAMISFREFVAPHAGVVAEVYKTPGESVSPNFPVFRIVDDGRMRVVGQLDVTDAWRVEVGQPVRIWPTVAGAELPVEREMFEGKVVLVDGQIDPATNTCKVVAEVANRANLLRAGLEARMEILPPSSSAQPAEGVGRPESPKPPDRR